MTKILLALSALLLFIPAAHAVDFDSFIKEGDTFYFSKQYDKAVEFFSKAIAADPKNAKGYWYRGDALFEQKKYAEAEADFTKSIELDSANPKVFNQRGNCYYNRFMYKEACGDYSKAILLNPASGTYRLYRADCYRMLKMNERALEDYAEAEKLGSKDARKWILTLKPAVLPSDPELKNVRLDLFTGAVALASGLAFDSFEIAPKDQNEYITGNDIQINFPFVLKIISPRGFAADTEGNAFVGAGFTLYDKAGTIESSVDDIYKDSSRGISAANISSLSMTITLPDLPPGSEHVLKLRFFDKKGTGSIDIVVPVRIGKKTSTAAYILKSTSTLGKGIETAAVKASADSVTLMDGNAEISPTALAAEKNYILRLNGFKDCDAVSFSAVFIDGEGRLSAPQKGGLISSGTLSVPVSSAGLSGRKYFLRIRIDGKDNQSCFCLMIPVAVK